MIYSILLSKQVQKVLDLLPIEFVKLFNEKAQILSKNPYSRDTNLDIVPLSGKPKGFYRIRIGEYRFLYEIRKSEIIIYFFKADKRGDVYK